MSTVPSHRGQYPVKQAPRPACRAFTLIELLVAVSVIGLLAAILVPALSRATVLARRTICQGNFRDIGIAVGVYQSEYGEYVPIASANVDPTDPGNVNLWQCWRASLLPNTTGFATFNCPAARDGGRNMELFHNNDEVTSRAADTSCGTANWGTYGIMYQLSLPSYETLASSGKIMRGAPARSQAFSTSPGVAWKDPTNTIYAADACLSGTPISYPSRSYKGTGTSYIYPPRISPSDPVPYKSSTIGTYGGNGLVRTFADRHLGTNCLFVDGHVAGYQTQVLDNMIPGAYDCVWDTQ